LASSIAPSVWRACSDQWEWELALVAGPCVLLAAIFVCLHRAERLTPDSPPGERWRLHVAAWVLATGIFCLVVPDDDVVAGHARSNNGGRPLTSGA